MILRRSALALATTASLVAGFEGFKTAAYLDPVGIPTACFGMTKGVEIGQEYSEAECEEYLFEQIIGYQRAVRARVDVDLTQDQLAAFTSFTYNVGVRAFESSTLRKKLNAGDTEGACNELLRWRYATLAGVKVELPGLVKRREVERDLCLNGVSSD
ncbi:lysozyme [Haliea salexigens]|uniref:lysozyme n=1 Tax=Haliea salexigens TaxID=287487 RepID=UPI000484813E|nr:lysozyme [Haliea salexigens]